MVDFVGIHAVAAWRLQTNKYVAKLQPGQRDVVLMDVSLAGGRSPLASHAALLVFRQGVEVTLVRFRRNLSDGIRKLGFSQHDFVVGTAVNQVLHERVAIWR